MPSDRTARILMVQQKQQELLGATHDKNSQGRAFPEPLRPAGRKLAVQMSEAERAQPVRRPGRRLLGS